MGILADVFVSKPEDAADYEQSLLARTRRERFTYVEYKGVTSLEFAQLIAILADAPFDDKAHQFPLVRQTEGTLFEEFPPDAVALLSALNSETLKTAAKNWCGIEEFKCAPEDLEPILADLQRLAHLAQAEAKRMYIWNSV